MTRIVSTATVDENNGLVVLLHLDHADAYETLRSNFCEEIRRGDVDGITVSLVTQGIHFDVYEHDIDLSDVKVELADVGQVYQDVYNTLDSHAFGATTVGHCACADWKSTDGGTYNDHLTQAVLTTLGLPIKENP